MAGDSSQKGVTYHEGGVAAAAVPKTKAPAAGAGALPGPGWSARGDAEDGHRAHRGGATDIVGEGGSGTVHLVAGLTPQLLEQLHALGHAGGPGGMALGLEAATGVDRDAAAHIVVAGFHQLVGLEAGGEAQVLVGDQFNAGEAV